jgi:hypothetical protein
MDDTKHLVYGLIDPRTNELRYVGKSSRGLSRPNFHRTNAGRCGRTHKHYWLRQLHRETGLVPSVIILATCETEAEAFAAERKLISTFRELGLPLVNITDGGEGASGITHTCSAATREKLRLVGLGRKPNAKQLEALRRGRKSGCKGYKHTEEWKQAAATRMAAHMAAVPAEVRAETSRRLASFRTAETYEKISRAQVGKVISADTRLKCSAALKGKPWSEARRKAQTARQSAVPVCAGITATISDAVKTCDLE